MVETRDIAELYYVETKRINEAVKNNSEKFPERFSFVITNIEKENLWSKFSTANINKMSRVNPRVFTEQGIYMLATYAGKELLDILRKINKKFIIVSKNINNVLKKKYLKQYNNVSFVENNSFHDSFLIIDRYLLYTCGASFKDLGKSCFTIIKLNDVNYTTSVLREININN